MKLEVIEEFIQEYPEFFAQSQSKRSRLGWSIHAQLSKLHKGFEEALYKAITCEELLTIVKRSDRYFSRLTNTLQQHREAIQKARDEIESMQTGLKPRSLTKKAAWWLKHIQYWKREEQDKELQRAFSIIYESLGHLDNATRLAIKEIITKRKDLDQITTLLEQDTYQSIKEASTILLSEKEYFQTRGRIIRGEIHTAILDLQQLTELLNKEQDLKKYSLTAGFSAALSVRTGPTLLGLNHLFGEHLFSAELQAETIPAILSWVIAISAVTAAATWNASRRTKKAVAQRKQEVLNE